MAPEIALERVQCLGDGCTVLDPMSGSGMVLGQASRLGLKSVGYELDPLARLISRVVATRVNEKRAREALESLLKASARTLKRRKKVALPWIDDDAETTAFVRYWFDAKQERQLRSLAHHLVVEPISKDYKIQNVLKVAVSRLIISKEPKASLARDTAHSRPHKVIETNDFDVFAELPGSFSHVLAALESSSITVNAKTYLGDARRMTQLGDGSVDAVITSPPYLNAIDYMRGHKFSLVWLGYRVAQLRSIRAHSIGTEVSRTGDLNKHFIRLAERLEVAELPPRTLRMLAQYFIDLKVQAEESHRVLKEGARATYVVGNSTLGGCYIRNSEFLKEAARLAGFSLKREIVRDIPNNRRYLPMPAETGNALAARMRTEHIIEFAKPRRRRRASGGTTNR